MPVSLESLFTGPLGLILTVAVGVWLVVNMLGSIIRKKWRPLAALLVGVPAGMLLEWATLIDVCGATPCSIGQRLGVAAVFSAIGVAVAAQLHDQVQARIAPASTTPLDPRK